MKHTLLFSRLVVLPALKLVITVYLVVVGACIALPAIVNIVSTPAQMDRAHIPYAQLAARAKTGQAELERRADALHAGDYKPGELDRLLALRECVRADYAELNMREEAAARRRAEMEAMMKDLRSIGRK